MATSKLASQSSEPKKDVNRQMEQLKVFQKPQCLIETDGKGHLVINKETAVQLVKIDMAINVIAITGLYRTGKSYLLNCLANHKSGFALGSTIQSKTKGIWVWCKIHPTQKDQVLMLLNTEGLGDAEKGSPNHDNKLFIIAALLSSTLIYNIMTAFNQDAIEKLTFITEMSKNLRISATDTSDDNFDLLMPQFVLCIRDVSLYLEIDGQECSEDEYLEHCLREKVGDEKYNRPRRCIKKYFTRRKAFTFDRPASRALMKKLDEVREEDLSPEFVKGTAKFKSFIYECPSKMLQNKKPVIGRMIVELLRVYVDAINTGKVPCVGDAITVMSKMENKRRALAAIKSYEEQLRNIELPVPNKGILLSKCTSIQTSILTTLNAELLFDDGHRTEHSTKAKMEDIYQKFEDENSKQLYKKCYRLLTKLYDEEVKDNVINKKYMIAGGYDRYKCDMVGTLDKYTNQLSRENVDPMEVQRAKKDFCTEKFSEGEQIMTADKNISEEEKQAMKQEFEAALNSERERYTEELQRQIKRHEEKIAQEERDRANRYAYLEERLAQLDNQVLELAKDIAYMKGEQEAKERQWCSLM